MHRADDTKKSPRAIAVAEILRDQCDAATRNHRLGHELELARTLGIGRRTMRSAVRELERQGIVRVERGHNGGLFVNAPPMDRAAQMLSDMVTLMNCSIRQVAATSMALYRIAAPLAAANRSGERATHLRRALTFAQESRQGHLSVDDWGALRHAVVQAASSPALATLQGGFQAAYRDALAAELRLGALEVIRSHPLWELENTLVQAVTSGDAQGARNAAHAVTKLEAAYLDISLSEGLVSTTLLPETLYQPQPMQRTIGGKLAHQTLRALHAHIYANRIKSGSKLGSAAHLANRLGVGMDVMREALTLAREQNLIELRRGRGGGIFMRDGHAETFLQIASMIAQATSSEDVEAVLVALRAETMETSLSSLPVDLLTKASGIKASRNARRLSSSDLATDNRFKFMGDGVALERYSSPERTHSSDL